MSLRDILTSRRAPFWMMISSPTFPRRLVNRLDGPRFRSRSRLPDPHQIGNIVASAGTRYADGAHGQRSFTSGRTRLCAQPGRGAAAFIDNSARRDRIVEARQGGMPNRESAAALRKGKRRG